MKKISPKSLLASGVFAFLFLGSVTVAQAKEMYSYVDADGCIQIVTVHHFLGFSWNTYDSPNC